MIGTLINVAAVVAGAAAGRLLGDRFSPRIRETTLQVIGLVTIVLGLDLARQSNNMLYVLGGLVLGGAAGELLQLEERLGRIGDRAEARLSRGGGEPGSFSEGFVSTSILFCVGPLTILGCLRDGLSGDYRLLAVKSLLDGISSIAFASALGWGVMLSAVTVLVVQGSLTLGAGALAPLLTDQALMVEAYAAGGVMMLGLGLRLLNLVKVRVANLLPALVAAPALVGLARLAEAWWSGAR